jgi:cell wall-associated NlpC family hydrolase
MLKFLPILLLLFFSACKSTRVHSTSYEPNPVLNELAVYAISLEGTPYKYGGTSPDTGFDCSGFVGHVFKQSLGKSLPRSSEEISRVGTEQDSEELQPGDLVFFNTLNKSYSHVGIYLGDGQFIHSPSTGKSVTVVNINDSYWRKRYNGARRIKP